MKNHLLIPLFVLVFFPGIREVMAQEAVLVSGAAIRSDAGSVTYSVGQPLILTNTGSTGIVSEGVQQPYEILIPVGLADLPGKTDEWTIYPNPVSSTLTLRTDLGVRSGMAYSIYSMTGTLVLEGMIIEKETQINMDNLDRSVYFLRVSRNGLSVQTFYIIKK